MNVQRWDVYPYYDGLSTSKSHGGDWVKHSDVTALESEVARLREALQGLFTVSRSDCNGRDCGACSTCRAIAALAPAQKDVPRG